MTPKETSEIQEIFVTNSISRRKERLETRVPGKLTMYSCGPTVYGFIHIGNLRALLTADMFFRVFKRAGYDVTYVRNYTDVDDKIIKRANEEGISSEEVARKYTLEVEKDCQTVGVLEPTHKTTVTTHIAEIITMVERIIAAGKAYVVDGEVLFSIADFPGYGKLSGKNIEDLVAGARVEVRDMKRNPLDFSLWKPAKPDEPSWDSPWGKGRPGWHIECSAMSSKWLGDQIDVHHGGEDLIFPHHENEIAQSEAASGKAPFVKYWLHHVFVNMAKEKMSKSLGNVLTARDFLNTYSGEFARYLLLSVHYRSIIEFGEEAVDQTLNSLQRIYEAKQKACEVAARPALVEAPEWAAFRVTCAKTRKDMGDAFAHDFNTPGAMAAVFVLIREFNRICATGAQGGNEAARLLTEILEEDLDGVLGVGQRPPEDALKDLQRIRGARQTAVSGAAAVSKDEIDALIAERLAARKTKNFARSDEIRKDLQARGVILKDGPGGTTWEYGNIH
ncbi:cysteine--tRNA ligase [Bdellovibrionota bacterium FG-2]